jgi:mannose-6-phosphate isomerase-like protein (cupin superfamily)
MLEGEATFTVGDDKITVGAGQIVVAPAGVPPTSLSIPGADH